MPVNHIENYAKFLENLLNAYKARDFLTEDFRIIAAVEIEMKKLHKLVSENFTLNSMKTSTLVNHEKKSNGTTELIFFVNLLFCFSFFQFHIAQLNVSRVWFDNTV